MIVAQRVAVIKQRQLSRSDLDNDFGWIRRRWVTAGDVFRQRIATERGFGLWFVSNGSSYADQGKSSGRRSGRTGCVVIKFATNTKHKSFLNFKLI
jgi:hypothetical protein